MPDFSSVNHTEFMEIVGRLNQRILSRAPSMPNIIDPYRYTLFTDNTERRVRGPTGLQIEAAFRVAAEAARVEAERKTFFDHLVENADDDADE